MQIALEALRAGSSWVEGPLATDRDTHAGDQRTRPPLPYTAQHKEIGTCPSPVRALTRSGCNSVCIWILHVPKNAPREGDAARLPLARNKASFNRTCMSHTYCACRPVRHGAFSHALLPRPPVSLAWSWNTYAKSPCIDIQPCPIRPMQHHSKTSTRCGLLGTCMARMLWSRPTQ